MEAHLMSLYDYIISLCDLGDTTIYDQHVQQAFCGKTQSTQKYIDIYELVKICRVCNLIILLNSSCLCSEYRQENKPLEEYKNLLGKRVVINTQINDELIVGLYGIVTADLYPPEYDDVFAVFFDNGMWIAMCQEQKQFFEIIDKEE